MKLVILDGYTENPGDLSWDGLRELAEVTVYDRTSLTDPADDRAHRGCRDRADQQDAAAAGGL